MHPPALRHASDLLTVCYLQTLPCVSSYINWFIVWKSRVICLALESYLCTLFKGICWVSLVMRFVHLAVFSWLKKLNVMLLENNKKYSPSSTSKRSIWKVSSACMCACFSHPYFICQAKAWGAFHSPATPGKRHYSTAVNTCKAEEMTRLSAHIWIFHASAEISIKWLNLNSVG